MSTMQGVPLPGGLLAGSRAIPDGLWCHACNMAALNGIWRVNYGLARTVKFWGMPSGWAKATDTIRRRFYLSLRSRCAIKVEDLERCDFAMCC